MTNLASILSAEYHTDILLGVIYLGIATFTGYRLYFYWNDPKNSRVFTMFNCCICIACISRSTWLFLPQTSYDTMFTENALISYVTPGWIWFLLSEILFNSGSIFFYSVFILLGLYWSHLLQKLKNPGVHSSPVPGSSVDEPKTCRYSPVHMFYSIISVLVFFQCLGTLLFLYHKFNSYQMILYDCVMYDVLSIGILFWLWYVTFHLRNVLVTTESSSQLAVLLRRLSQVAHGVNVFFIYRVASETALLCILAVGMLGMFPLMLFVS
jgi:hypothetical protein